MSTGHIPVQKSHLVFSQVAAYCHCTWTSDGCVCCLVPLINCMTSDHFSSKKKTKLQMLENVPLEGAEVFCPFRAATTLEPISGTPRGPKT